jgi:hypothetical protein
MMTTCYTSLLAFGTRLNKHIRIRIARSDEGTQAGSLRYVNLTLGAEVRK